MSKLVEDLLKRLKYVSEKRITETVWADEAAELLAHIERLEANQIPEGFVAVPREPTDGMIDAGCDAANFYRVDLVNAYDAMIQAATHGEGE